MDVKNQHYVPRAYLANFADDQGKIWMFDKTRRTKANPNIKGVAAENGFYDSDTLKKVFGDKQFIEKKLVQVEGDYANAVKLLLQSIESGCYNGVYGEARHFLSVYMVIQMIRTREHRILLGEASRFFDARVPDMWREDATQEDILNRHLDSLLDSEQINKMAEILYDHTWVVQKAYKDEVFYTSDNPLARRGHINSPNSWMSMSGINSPGIEIVFPITSRYLLVLYERSYHRLAPMP